MGGHRLLRGNFAVQGLGEITPIMDNQMAKKK